MQLIQLFIWGIKTKCYLCRLYGLGKVTPINGGCDELQYICASC